MRRCRRTRGRLRRSRGSWGASRSSILPGRSPRWNAAAPARRRYCRGRHHGIHRRGPAKGHEDVGAVWHVDSAGGGSDVGRPDHPGHGVGRHPRGRPGLARGRIQDRRGDRSRDQSRPRRGNPIRGQRLRAQSRTGRPAALPRLRGDHPGRGRPVRADAASRAHRGQRQIRREDRAVARRPGADGVVHFRHSAARRDRRAAAGQQRGGPDGHHGGRGGTGTRRRCRHARRAGGGRRWPFGHPLAAAAVDTGPDRRPRPASRCEGAPAGAGHRRPGHALPRWPG